MGPNGSNFGVQTTTTVHQPGNLAQLVGGGRDRPDIDKDIPVRASLVRDLCAAVVLRGQSRFPVHVGDSDASLSNPRPARVARRGQINAPTLEGLSPGSVECPYLIGEHP